MKKTLLLLAFLLMAVCSQAQLQFFPNGKLQPMRKLQMAEYGITNFYVDSVDESALVEDAIRGMIKQLDPHSAYTNAKETKALNEPLEGDFEGIGVQFNIIDDTLVVVQTVRNGPSEKVGIQPGDRIISVNDTAIAGVKMAQSDIMKRLRGKKGSKVRLGIVRRGVGDVLKFTVKRAKIPVHSINASYMIEPGVGYVRIESFGAKTYREFMNAVDSLKRKGMKTLMLDLQQNGGGYLQAAVMIANEFLRANDMIVYTEGRRVPRQDFRANGNGRLKNIKVVVLTDELTASASEIVSGAIQDNDRGTIVGRRTFGKGLVQRPLGFPDGSMIRLTVAHYFTPSGRCIQKPYKKGDKVDYDMDLENRLKHGELTSRDSIHFDDSLKCYTLRQHRPVYGGGGIMPDVFVPLDTMKYTRFHRQLMAKSIVIKQDLKYVDSHRKELMKKYTKFKSFDQKFKVPSALIDSIIAEGARNKITPKDDAELKRTLKYLRPQLKALIARDIFDMNAYFKIWNRTSDICNRALEVINSRKK